MNRRLFWPLIALAPLLETIAAATFAASVFSDPISRRARVYEADSVTEIFERVTSLDWSSDRDLLIATILFAAFGLAMYIRASRLR